MQFTLHLGLELTVDDSDRIAEPLSQQRIAFLGSRDAFSLFCLFLCLSCKALFF